MVPINSRGTFARIHLSHIESNFNFIKTLVGEKTFICPMIKADAYGHGDVLVGRKLESLGVRAVGVISIEEAIHLREGGLQVPILTFGAFDTYFVTKIFEYKLTPVISTWEQFDALAPLIKTTPLNIHLKFNTGMNRLGFSVEEAKKVFERLDSKFHLDGICMHFLNGEDIDDPRGYSAEQIKQFEKVTKIFESKKPIIHYLNSAAMLVGGTKNVGVRPGISLYGYSPLSRKNNSPLKPVMTVHSRIEIVRKPKKGEAVSYGPVWKADRDSVIAVVPIGYADGYYRGLTNKGSMLYKGRRVPVCGTVCMDYCMVDLTDIPGEPQVGEEIVVIGPQGTEQIGLMEIAAHMNTIPYEFLTRVGKRLNRVAVD